MPYTAELHNALLGADDAADRFESLNGKAAVDGVLKDIIFRYNVADDFAIRLLHRHFDVKDGEKVVHHGNVAMPWEIPSLPEAVRERVVPSSFMTTSSGLFFPYEFTYGDSKGTGRSPDELLALHGDFIRDFGAALQQLGLIDVLSLAVAALMPGGIGMETTEGRANITIPMEASDALGGDGHIETVWTFDPLKPHAKGKCKYFCRKKDSHVRIHVLGQ